MKQNQIKCDSASSTADSSQYNYPHNFRTAYGPKLKIALQPRGESRTKQSFKAECDINHIMARFLRTGVIDAQNRHAPRYGDCSGQDFTSYMNIIASSRSIFQELPAQLRARFENSPAKFLDFVHDARNAEEARELGLLKPAAPEATPLPTPPASDAGNPPLASREAMRKQARADGEAKAKKEGD